MKRSTGFLKVCAVVAVGLVGCPNCFGSSSDLRKEDCYDCDDMPVGCLPGRACACAPYDAGADSEAGSGAAGECDGGMGDCVWHDAGDSGGFDCGKYLTGKVRSVEDIANTVDEDSAVEIRGAIATTKPILTYFNKIKNSCLWSVFVRDPVANRGLMVHSYGEDAPTSDQTTCPKAGGFIPFDIVPGDVLTIVGKTSLHGAVTPKQRQVQALCTVVKTGTAPVVPVVVSDLDGIALGKPEYQNLLVKIEDVTIKTFFGGNGIEYPANQYGDIALQGTNLVVKNTFYYRELGSGTWDKAQHFDYIIGIVHSDYFWALFPRNRCEDLSPPSSIGCP